MNSTFHRCPHYPAVRRSKNINRLVALLLQAIVVLASSTVLAKDGDGYYFSLAVGQRYTTHGSVESVLPNDPLATTEVIRNDDEQPFFAIAGGYASKRVPVRVEGYFSRTGTQSFVASTVFHPSLFTEHTMVEYTQSMGLIRAFYEFDAAKRIKPYMGAGAGFARNSVSAEQYDFEPSDRSASFAAGMKTAFAWQLGAGIRFPVSSRVSFGFEYSYTRMGTVRTSRPCASSYEFMCDQAEYHQGKPESNSLSLLLNIHPAPSTTEVDWDRVVRVSQKATPELRRSFDVGIGYRRDDLRWSIAGNTVGNDPNILSELTWSDVTSVQLQLNAKIPVVREHLYFQPQLAFGGIIGGQNQDSDYAADDRTEEVSRSLSDADRGRVSDMSVGFGYELRFSGDRWRIAPIVGYSLHEQLLKDSNGRQVIGEVLGPFTETGPNAEYKARWHGPWIGVDAGVRVTKSWALSAALEYHWADYEAEADWLLRSDLAHPTSFEDRADGSGLVASVYARCKIFETGSIMLSVDHQTWSTGEGLARQYLASGSTVETRFNGADWESLAATVGVDLRW